jgi:hypothetical protein
MSDGRLISMELSSLASLPHKDTQRRDDLLPF